MRVAAILLTCAIASAAGAAERTTPGGYTVIAHLTNATGVAVPASLLWDGEQAATTIFSKLHIQLIWRARRSSDAQTEGVPCPGNAPVRDLTIEIVSHAPPIVKDSALAMAMPFAVSGVRIVIFFDRVEPLLEGHSASESKVLGYLLAHEIGHVLQGTTGHSDAGIMRARWTQNDFQKMGAGTLTFSHEEVERMRIRLHQDACLDGLISRSPATEMVQHSLDR